MEIIHNEKFIKTGLEYSEKAVVISSAFLLAYMTLDITMLKVQIPDWLFMIVQIILTLAVMVRILIQAKDRMLWAGIGSGILYYLSWNFYTFQLMALMSVAYIGISYRKILKVYLIGVGLMVTGTVLLALAGGVTNLIYMKDGFLRSSMGIIFPTDFASIILFILLTLWVYWEELPDEATFILPVFSTWVAWYLARSYTSTLCSLLFLAAVVYRVFEMRIIDKKKILLWIRKTVDVLCVIMFPALMILMFVLMAAYARGYSFAYVINNLMSGRVRLSLDALRENGISLFGHAISQAGAGGSTYSNLTYEFVDSSYPRILLFYGVAIMMLVCALWVFLTLRAIKADRRRMVFVLAIIAFHSLSEHHFIEPVYNIFLLLPFSSMESGIMEKVENRKTVLLQWGIGIAGIVIAVMLLPGTLSRFRITVLEIKSQLAMLMMAIVMIASVLLMINACRKWITDVVLYERVKRKDIVVTLCACLILLLLTGWNLRITKYAMSDYGNLIKADDSVLQTILNAKTGKVYVDRLGELYRQTTKGISISAFDGEDLARFADVTVIVDEKMDSTIFINRGFLYTRISDDHAVYTNDVQVIDALKGSGHQLTAFCTAENELDLQDVAMINSLTVNEDGSVDLGGDSHSLIFGEGSNPFDIDTEKVINLHAGRYTANYQLKIDPDPYEKDYPVCRIVIDAYAGEKNLRTLTVYRSWFDEDGELDAKVVFDSGNNPYVIFRCLMEDGQKAILKNITWQRTPDYDKRPVYNENHDKIKDEFYDRTGAPVMNRQGYASCSYHYWDKVTVDEIRYFDLDDKPVNIKFGYAAVSRTYNIKRQMIKEEYFDANGDLVMCTDGYASREWEYDQNGNASVLSFHDLQGDLTMTSYGYAKISREYDEKHRVISELYFGADGMPIRIGEGYFGIRKSYDEETDTLPSEIIYTDANGDIMITDSGFSIKKLTYDGAQTIREELSCDHKGIPVIRKEGFSIEKRIFDPDGNVMIYQFCDPDGKSVMTDHGYAEVHRTYDENGFVTSESYFDDNGEQIELSDGFAIIKAENDEVGNIIYQRFYSLSGELIRETDSDFWFAIEEKKEPDKHEIL